MGFLSKITNALPVTAGAKSLFGGGFDVGAATLSGIPFLGEGFAAQQSQQFSAQQAMNQMAFQKHMSDTAHRREVSDLKAAGLNPILSANKGASTPSGAAGSGVFGSGASSTAKMLENLQKMEGAKAAAQIDRDIAQKELLNADKKVKQQQEQVAAASALGLKIDNKLKEFQIPGAEVESNFQRNYGDAYRKTNAIMDVVNKGASSAAALKFFFNPKSILGGRDHYKVDKRTGEILNDKGNVPRTYREKKRIPRRY